MTRLRGASLFVGHACPRAWAAGVKPEMPLAEARAVLPELIAQPYEPDRNAAGLEHLAVWAQKFSPLVESAWPDVLLLDVTGCEQVFGGEENIVCQAVAGLAERGLRARVAIADTIEAAWVLAHGADEPAVVAPPGQTAPLLVRLPPAAMRIEADVVATLDALGVRTIGDLLMLPRSTLPARFGPQLSLRVRLLLGETPERILSPRSDPAFSACLAFGPTDRLEVLLAALEKVTEALVEQLVSQDASARRLLGVVYFPERSPWSWEVGLSRPSRDGRHLATLLRARLERVDLSSRVAGLRITALETVSWSPAQGELFDDPLRSDDEALGGLIDRLANRLGARSVVRAEAVDDHQPERAIAYRPLVGGRTPNERQAKRDPRRTNKDKRKESDRTWDPAVARPSRRPLCLLQRAAEVRVISLVPDGPPTWFRYGGREYRVAQAVGPERLEVGWWRGPDVRRDYFRVVTEGGQRFWLYHDLATGRWFLHGSYE
ncbi:MAG: DNA polymerase Y family protein [bacterium]|nr:DNA polymerase Y family protein [bacterium]